MQVLQSLGDAAAILDLACGEIDRALGIEHHGLTRSSTTRAAVMATKIACPASRFG